MEISNPIFAGFFPKTTSPAPEEFKPASVEQIASVSECLSPGPPGWIQHWQHNQFGFYETDAQALSVVREENQQYDLYAYRIFPLRAIGEALEDLPLPSVSGNIPQDFEFLGYDIVTKSSSDFFECSPLSCNLAALQYQVNRWCLIADLEQAIRAMQEISQDGNFEPGPYYLFEVHRKRT